METVQITIKSGNALIPHEVYAVKTKKRELVIGYYSDYKNVFKSDTHSDIALDDIVAYASMEELQNKMNAL